MQAVCFDVDCTLTTGDGLDLLAEWKGVGEQVARITARAMDGDVSLERALQERLEAIDCSPGDIRDFLASCPPEQRLVPGAARLVAALQARGVAVYLISGGFRELTLPVARALGVPKENVFANRMLWRLADDDMEEEEEQEEGGAAQEEEASDGGTTTTPPRRGGSNNHHNNSRSSSSSSNGMFAPTRLAGFDLSEPTARNQGKPAAIRLIRRRNPYSTVVMVGDGITDLEAVQESGGADLFIGYGGVVQRPPVAAGADWFVLSHDQLIAALRRYRVAMVGSGAWASAAVRLVAQNTAGERDAADRFVDEVRMWVYEGEEACAAINASHENAAYLPGVPLGDNVVAGEFAFFVSSVLFFCWGRRAAQNPSPPFLAPLPPRKKINPPHPPLPILPPPPPPPIAKTPTSKTSRATPTCSSSASPTSLCAPPASA
jgi:glycerol-3-phosphate dehydrogenase (NAD+)